MDAQEQDQFLDVIDCDSARRRWQASAPSPELPFDRVARDEALGRTLAQDVLATMDVPGFDRSNLDGYAVRSEDTFGASEDATVVLSLNPESLATGVVPRILVDHGTATPIATGGMLPRGADAVAMIEITTLREGRLIIRKPVAPGEGVTFAGTDVATGERILRAGATLTSRETGVLAALGVTGVEVRRRPRVAIFSTGDEIVSPGARLPLGSVYDANATILADAVRECGGEPVMMGIVPDDENALDAALDASLARADLIVMSGGTSKGTGDVSYRVLARRSPGIIVHGVALKPGKPVCLGAVGPTPVAVLPGFPTSAIFTFHEFVAPRLREMLGLGDERRFVRSATMSQRVNSDRGRREYLLVHLFETRQGCVAYPMGKGSGSITSFAMADGFVTIPSLQEYVDEHEAVEVTMLGRGLAPADLVVIGSHCEGLDMVLGHLASDRITSKTIWVGSQGGLLAAGRGECDLAGVHLLDSATGLYNLPFLPDGVRLLEGYRRMQGLVTRRGDARGRSWDAFLSSLDDPTAVMVNRNRGSGTRVLIDQQLRGRRPAGYAVEAKSHNAVCAAIAQGRADWGFAIASVACSYDLDFLPLCEEHYDFAIPAERWDRPAVQRFREILASDHIRDALASRGFRREQTL